MSSAVADQHPLGSHHHGLRCTARKSRSSVMAGEIEAKLAELGITLPRPMQPIANYVPYVVTGNLVVVSGQVPAIDGKIAITGKVSWGVSPEQAKEAARLCFINVLVHLKAAW